MELIRDIHCLKEEHQACVLTIGNFDGVHLGHRAVIDQVVEAAQQRGFLSAVMIFEPQPQEFFSSQNSTSNYPLRIMDFSEKVKVLASLNVDRLVCVNFDLKFSTVTAHQFVDQYLCEKLNARHVVIGDDFRFGKGREGSYNLLQLKGRDRGFTVEQAATYEYLGNRVSSTRIRALIRLADLQKVEQLLTQPYSISGRVISGRRLGRQLGIPTANIELGSHYESLAGVYVVSVVIGDRSISDAAEILTVEPSGMKPEVRYQGVANLGLRPTVSEASGTYVDNQNSASSKKVYLEAHLFNFDEDIYDQTITVQLRHKLRAEKTFASVTDLKAAIDKDIQQAKAWFK